MRRFRKHQWAAYRYAKRRNFIALLMEMRLGKTLNAIRWAVKKAGPDGPVLIVTPSTTIHVWQNELQLEGCIGVPLIGSSAKKTQTLIDSIAVGESSWYLINPEGLRAAPDIATALPWEVVIADETGGWLTNPKSKISKLLQRSFQDIPNKAILTGLPDPNGAEDYVQQMIFAFGEFMGHRSFWTWRNDYMQPGYCAWELKPFSRRKIKREVKKLAFRMTAKQAGFFVPKVYETRVIQFPAELMKLTKQLKRDFDFGAAETKYAVVVNTWLSMLAGGIVPREYDPTREINNPFKVKEVLNLLKGELKGKRVVIWARFTRELKLMKTALTSAGIKTGLLHGMTRMKKRPAILTAFAGGKFPVLLVQAKVGQYGLNISHADTQIYYSNEWDWGIRGQCEKRCDDVTKKVPVLIIDLVAENTIDESLLTVLKEKKRSSKDFAQRVFARARKAGVI